MSIFYVDSGSFGDVQVTGSLFVTDTINVNTINAQTSSIQYITSSQLNIGTNIITVNSNTPSTRFGGLAVIDSGSSPQKSGSILFDSQNNQWIFIHQGGVGADITSSVFIQGPQTFNNVGNETTLTTNRIPKASGGDLGEHIGDSNITDTGTVVSINSNTTITGSLVTTQNISIGTTQTTSPLTIVSSASPLMTVQSTTANSYSNIRFSGSGRSYTTGVGNASETLFGVANSYFIYDDTAGAMRMTVDNTGKIGIGTTSPGSLLHVAGAVSASSYTGSGAGLTIQGSNFISPYGQIVFATGSNVTTNINSVGFVSVLSQTITGVSIGDVIEVDLTGTILNDSGANRTYTCSSSFGNLMNMSVSNGTYTAFSATNRQPVELKLIYTVSATNLAYAQQRQYFTITNPANTSNSALLTQLRSTWQTTTSNATGTQTIVIGFVSDNATATQTFTLHSCIIKRTPNRVAI